MEIVTYSFIFGFILSVGFNLFQTQVLVRMKRKVAGHQDLIDDLRAAVGGSSRDDWRNSTL